LDLDLEGTSVILDPKDSDFRSPTTPSIINLIKAVKQVMAQFPGGLILSLAPETAYVQGGYITYAGIFGAYLPIIFALRDMITYVHVQDYNTGSMYGRDGALYDPGTPDFLVAMADMLVAGFTVDAYNSKIPFPGLGADKVLIGIPASAGAAGSGYMPFFQVRSALDYLYTGKSFGGSYQLASPAGYSKFRGVMTWSINWDAFAGLSWSLDYRKYLNTLVTAVAGSRSQEHSIPTGIVIEGNYPNPFNPLTVIKYTIGGVRGCQPASGLAGGLGVSDVSLIVYDLLGREVATLVNERKAAGSYVVRFDGSRLATGMYVYRLTAGSFVQTQKMLLLK
jgi:hypothetical protein